MTPNCLADIFTYKSEILDHDLRGSLTSLQLPFPKTERLKKSFSYSVGESVEFFTVDIKRMAVSPFL